MPIKCEQKQTICGRIQQILREYPCGNTIFYEMMQNSDDAGASGIKLVLDRRDPLKPCVFFYNSAQFSERDIDNIQNIGGSDDSTKRHDATRIGRFGIGFNTVYHLTDTVSFVTGKTLIVFDPSQQHLPADSPSPAGFMCDVSNPDDYGSGEMSPFVENLLMDFEAAGMSFSREENFAGTIFRLPLRLQRSKLWSELHTLPQLEELMDDFATAAQLAVLLMKNVNCIEAFVLDADSNVKSPLKTDDDDASSTAENETGADEGQEEEAVINDENESEDETVAVGGVGDQPASPTHHGVLKQLYRINTEAFRDSATANNGGDSVGHQSAVPSELPQWLSKYTAVMNDVSNAWRVALEQDLDSKADQVSAQFVEQLPDPVRLSRVIDLRVETFGSAQRVEAVADGPSDDGTCTDNDEIPSSEASGDEEEEGGSPTPPSSVGDNNHCQEEDPASEDVEGDTDASEGDMVETSSPGSTVRHHTYTICHALGPGGGWEGSNCWKVADRGAMYPEFPICVPWSTVLVEDGKPLGPGKARTCCFFPIGGSTELPVHVHGYFKLSSCRQTIVVNDRWTKTLAAEVVPYAYSDAIQAFLDQGKPSYCLWPTSEYTDTLVALMATSTLQRLSTLPVIRTMPSTPNHVDVAEGEEAGEEDGVVPSSASAAAVPSQCVFISQLSTTTQKLIAALSQRTEHQLLVEGRMPLAYADTDEELSEYLPHIVTALQTLSKRIDQHGLGLLGEPKDGVSDEAIRCVDRSDLFAIFRELGEALGNDFTDVEVPNEIGMEVLSFQIAGGDLSAAALTADAEALRTREMCSHFPLIPMLEGTCCVVQRSKVASLLLCVYHAEYHLSQQFQPLHQRMVFLHDEGSTNSLEIIAHKVLVAIFSHPSQHQCLVTVTPSVLAQELKGLLAGAVLATGGGHSDGTTTGGDIQSIFQLAVRGDSEEEEYHETAQLEEQQQQRGVSAADLYQYILDHAASTFVDVPFVPLRPTGGDQATTDVSDVASVENGEAGNSRQCHVQVHLEAAAPHQRDMVLITAPSSRRTVPHHRDPMNFELQDSDVSVEGDLTESMCNILVKCGARRVSCDHLPPNLLRQVLSLEKSSVTAVDSGKVLTVLRPLIQLLLRCPADIQTKLDRSEIDALRKFLATHAASLKKSAEPKELQFLRDLPIFPDISGTLKPVVKDTALMTPDSTSTSADAEGTINLTASMLSAGTLKLEIPTYTARKSLFTLHVPSDDSQRQLLAVLGCNELSCEVLTMIVCSALQPPTVGNVFVGSSTSASANQAWCFLYETLAAWKNNESARGIAISCPLVRSLSDHHLETLKKKQFLPFTVSQSSTVFYTSPSECVLSGVLPDEVLDVLDEAHSSKLTTTNGEGCRPIHPELPVVPDMQLPPRPSAASRGRDTSAVVRGALRYLGVSDTLNAAAVTALLRYVVSSNAKQGSADEDTRSWEGSLAVMYCVAHLLQRGTAALPPSLKRELQGNIKLVPALEIAKLLRDDVIWSFSSPTNVRTASVLEWCPSLLPDAIYPLFLEQLRALLPTADHLAKLSSFFHWNTQPTFDEVVKFVNWVGHPSRSDADEVAMKAKHIRQCYQKLEAESKQVSSYFGHGAIQQLKYWYFPSRQRSFPINVLSREEATTCLEPELGYVDRETASAYPTLMQTLKIPPEHTAAIKIKAALKVFPVGRPLDDDKRRQLRDALQLLAGMCHKTPSLISSMGDMPVPTSDGSVALAKDVSYDFYNKHPLRSHTILHEVISCELAKKLGMKHMGVTKMKQLQGRNKYGIQARGQRESLVKGIRRILADYSDRQSVFLEMIQNADDAGAKTVRFVLDDRKFEASESEGLMGQGMKVLQGPALVVQNDATFREEDFDAIHEVSSGHKVKNRLASGRFGVGFNSVYHLTDCPFLVSRTNVAIFDPSAKHLEMASAAQPGVFIEFDDDLAESFPHQFKPFLHYGIDFKSSFEGTLFRLPLRTKVDAEKNVVSSTNDTVWSAHQLRQEMTRFSKETLPHVALFLKSVERIELVELDSSNREIVTAVVSVSNTEQVQQRRREVAQMHSDPLGQTMRTVSGQVNLEHRGWGAQCATKSEWIVTDVLGAASSKPHLAGAPPEMVSKLLPSAGCALPLSAWQAQAVGSTSGGGLVFCYLPLPITSALPYHLHGCLALSSSRREVFLGDGHKGWEKTWNSYIIRELMSAAILSVLPQLPSPKRAAFWPTEVSAERKTPVTQLVAEGFIDHIISDPLKVFWSSTAKLDTSFQECRFLDEGLIGHHTTLQHFIDEPLVVLTATQRATLFDTEQRQLVASKRLLTLDGVISQLRAASPQGKVVSGSSVFHTNHMKPDGRKKAVELLAALCCLICIPDGMPQSGKHKGAGLPLVPMYSAEVDSTTPFDVSTMTLATVKCGDGIHFLSKSWQSAGNAKDIFPEAELDELTVDTDFLNVLLSHWRQAVEIRKRMGVGYFSTTEARSTDAPQLEAFTLALRHCSHPLSVPAPPLRSLRRHPDGTGLVWSGDWTSEVGKWIAAVWEHIIDAVRRIDSASSSDPKKLSETVPGLFCQDLLPAMDGDEHVLVPLDNASKVMLATLVPTTTTSTSTTSETVLDSAAMTPLRLCGCFTLDEGFPAHLKTSLSLYFSVVRINIDSVCEYLLRRGDAFNGNAVSAEHRNTFLRWLLQRGKEGLSRLRGYPSSGPRPKVCEAVQTLKLFQVWSAGKGWRYRSLPASGNGVYAVPSALQGMECDLLDGYYQEPYEAVGLERATLEHFVTKTLVPACKSKVLASKISTQQYLHLLSIIGKKARDDVLATTHRSSDCVGALQDIAFLPTALHRRPDPDDELALRFLCVDYIFHHKLPLPELTPKLRSELETRADRYLTLDNLAAPKDFYEPVSKDDLPKNMPIPDVLFVLDKECPQQQQQHQVELQTLHPILAFQSDVRDLIRCTGGIYAKLPVSLFSRAKKQLKAMCRPDNIERVQLLARSLIQLYYTAGKRDGETDKQFQTFSIFPCCNHSRVAGAPILARAADLCAYDRRFQVSRSHGFHFSDVTKLLRGDRHDDSCFHKPTLEDTVRNLELLSQNPDLPSSESPRGVLDACYHALFIMCGDDKTTATVAHCLNQGDLLGYFPKRSSEDVCFTNFDQVHRSFYLLDAVAKCSPYLLPSGRLFDNAAKLSIKIRPSDEPSFDTMTQQLRLCSANVKQAYSCSTSTRTEDAAFRALLSLVARHPVLSSWRVAQDVTEKARTSLGDIEVPCGGSPPHFVLLKDVVFPDNQVMQSRLTPDAFHYFTFMGTECCKFGVPLLTQVVGEGPKEDLEDELGEEQLDVSQQFPELVAKEQRWNAWLHSPETHDIFCRLVAEPADAGSRHNHQDDTEDRLSGHIAQRLHRIRVRVVHSVSTMLFDKRLPEGQRRDLCKSRGAQSPLSVLHQIPNGSDGHLRFIIFLSVQPNRLVPENEVSDSIVSEALFSEMAVPLSSLLAKRLSEAFTEPKVSRLGDNLVPALAAMLECVGKHGAPSYGLLQRQLDHFDVPSHAVDHRGPTSGVSSFARCGLRATVAPGELMRFGKCLLPPTDTTPTASSSIPMLYPLFHCPFFAVACGRRSGAVELPRWEHRYPITSNTGSGNPAHPTTTIKGGGDDTTTGEMVTILFPTILALR